ncbi:MAG: hypothetical protein RL042_300 [Nitrospirota bacterium]
MQKTRVYIVEDEALIAMEIGDRLMRLGYDICGKAARGEQALEEIPQVRPDIVLMDISLAGQLTGIDTAARLRQLLDVPVVFLSAFSDAALVEGAIGSGAFGYLLKPFEERELHATLQAALAKHRQERALQDANARLDAAVRQRTDELRNSEERFRAAYHNAASGMSICDLTGRLQEVNRALCEILGYSEQELLAKDFQSLTHPDDLPGNLDRINRLLTGTALRQVFEKRYVRKDGGTIWAHVGLSVIRNQNGTPTHLLAVVKDITARKQTEQALHFLSANISHLSGDEFFSKIAAQAAQLLGLEIGFVCQPLATQTSRIRTLGLSIDGQTMPPMEYDLAGTPCEQVLDKQAAIFTEQVQQLFPEDQMLADLGVSSYAAVSLLDQNGRPIGHIGVMSRRPLRQVSQVEEILRLFALCAAAELARQRTETKFQDLFEFSPDAVILVNQAGLITLANHQAELLFGYSRAEFLGMPVERLMPESARQGHVHLRQQFLASATPRMMGAGRLLRALKKDGTIFPVDISLSPIQSEEGHLVVAAIRDITERKQTEQSLRESEERFRQVTENITQVFWMTDVTKHTILYISPAYEHIWGRTREDLYASPLQCLESIHPDDRDRVRQATFTKQSTGNYNETYRIIRPDGSERWILDRAFPVKDDRGQVYRITGIAKDITEHKQAEAALAASQDQIRQMQKLDALGQLAGGIAHDFNNLLTAILGYTELAGTKLAADHPSRTHLARIREAGDRASQLVQQILAFTHQQPLARTVVPLAPVVSEVLALLRATLPAHIELTSSEVAGTPPVLADTTQIHQVLMNLCTNAWHALGQEKGTITVELAPVTLTQELRAPQATLPPGFYARLSVRDTGHGMAPETVARIFDPFFTTKPVGQGTGLGLSVVHGIMQQHDGAILVDSRPGQGTTFHLYVPAVEVSTQTQEPDGATPALKPGRSRHLLYLDDEAMLVELVRDQFEQLGYRVTGCTQPTEALALVRADPHGVDVVVTDYNMPEMSGLEVARMLAQLRADLPVVLVSGYLSSDVRAAALAVGIKEVVPKPTLLQHLGDVVARLLDAPPQT